MVLAPEQTRVTIRYTDQVVHAPWDVSPGDVRQVTRKKARGLESNGYAEILKIEAPGLPAIELGQESSPGNDLPPLTPGPIPIPGDEGKSDSEGDRKSPAKKATRPERQTAVRR